MTVGELIEKLKEVNPHLTVLVSNDPEGNAIRELDDVTIETEDTDSGEPEIILWP